MARGVIPRQPAKTGRHEAARKVELRSAKPTKDGGRSNRSTLPATKAKAKSAATSAIKSGKAPSGYNPLAPERVSEILKRLEATYPGATCALKHTNAWELLVATILSAQCTDVRVNMTTPELFRKYPTVQDFAALKPEATRTGYQVDWLLSQQIKVGGGRSQKDCQRLRRSGSGQHGRPALPARSRA